MAFFALQTAFATPLTPVFINLPPDAGSVSSLTNFAVSTNISDYTTWNVKIDGPGYLIVRDPVDGSFGATRFGAFNLDSNGFLITTFGRRLQGYADSSLTILGDIRITNVISQGAEFFSESGQIQSNGFVIETFPGGSPIVIGQVALQNFQNPSALIAQGWRCYGWSASAGPLPAAVSPGTSGTGWLVPRSLEQLTPKVQISLPAGPPQPFTQGVLVSTGVSADLGIEGQGFFVLRRTNDNALFATRAGAFYTDGSGYLVHYSGLRLEGYNDSAQTSVGDVQIDAAGSAPTGNPSAFVLNFDIDQRGILTEYLTDGSPVVRGQILLAECSNPNLVTRTNFDLYPIIPNNGLWAPWAPPMTGNLGWLVTGTLESSQFDTNLIAVRNRLNFFSQGYLTGTGISSDLAISGPGFFNVRDPVTHGLYATRGGVFQMDASGYLVTSNGLRVQGFTNEFGSQIGDIMIPSGAVSYSVDRDGNTEALFPDGASFSCGTILLQQYRNLQALVPIGNLLYSNLTDAMPMVTNAESNNPLSSIQSGAIEQPAPPPSAIRLPPPAGGFHLFISNLTAGTVQSSTDLVHWNAIGQVDGSPDLNIGEFIDTPQSSQTFYRIVVPRSGGN